LRPNTKAESGETEVLIERLGHQGDGIALIAGRAVHVPLTAPGDRVRIAYGGTQGHVLERLSDGADRVVPPCPHFGTCGGCALQHMSEAAYRAFKMESLRETLAQRGISVPLETLTVIPAATRRRATFAFQNGALGFYRAGTRAVLDLARCLVLRPEIMDALSALRAMLPDGAGRLHVTLTQTGLDVDLTAPPRRTELPGLVRLTVDGAPFAQHGKPLILIDGIAVNPPPRAFLQPSAEGEAQLIAWVREGVGNAKLVLDLFSGLGTFALPLAKAASVHAVDSDDALLAALSDAARHASGLKPVTIEARDLLKSPLPPAVLKRYDAVVFDPPRAGAKAQTQALAQSGVKRLVAVSCNAATFARDARMLCDQGYKIEWIRPLDQFVWSAHIELVALFTKEAKR
jgi:23S rRNA (uracil1939-C5)-methyltransferase